MTLTDSCSSQTHFFPVFFISYADWLSCIIEFLFILIFKYALCILYHTFVLHSISLSYILPQHFDRDLLLLSVKQFTLSPLLFYYVLQALCAIFLYVTLSESSKTHTCHRTPSPTPVDLDHRQQQQPFYGPLSGTTRVSRYQKKHSPTHHPDHHPIFISFFHLPRSIASSFFEHS